MLNLAISFQLIARGPGALPHSSHPELRRSTTAEVILEGYRSRSRQGQRHTKSLQIVRRSTTAPVHSAEQHARWLWPLIDGMSIEQQMTMPMGGEALAVSWRVNGPTFFPCRLGVRPIFRPPQPFRGAGSEFEPEPNGGRLAWQPLKHSSRVIAPAMSRP
jgi:hypothetical protein